MSQWFYSKDGSKVFKIVRIIKDHHDNPYILKCITKSDREIFFMSGEFQDLYKKGKIKKLNTTNK